MTKRRVAVHRAVDCAKKMPPLRHTPPGQPKPFDIRRSEVAAWLVARPEIMQYVFDAARSAGVISYDPKTGTWRGADR